MTEKIITLQFRVDEVELQRIDDLKKGLVGLRNRAQLINYALTLLNWCVQERRKGRIIASMDESAGTYKELEIEIKPLREEQQEV